MKISKDTAVTINFTMSNDTGDVIDSTEDAPLIYLHGHENIMAGLETALEGKEAGSSFEVILTPDDAFGEKDEELLVTVSKDDFDSGDIQVGMQFQTMDEDENLVIATVVEINDDKVIVDENHPLAGMTLIFKGDILEVRDATEEEISHGHIHGDHDHHDHNHNDQKDDCCSSGTCS